VGRRKKIKANRKKNPLEKLYQKMRERVLTMNKARKHIPRKLKTFARARFKRFYRGEGLTKGRFSMKKSSIPIEQSDVGGLWDPLDVVSNYSYDHRIKGKKRFKVPRTTVREGKLRSSVYGIDPKIFNSKYYVGPVAGNPGFSKILPKYKKKGYVAMVPAKIVKKRKGKKNLSIFLSPKNEIMLKGVESEIYKKSLEKGHKEGDYGSLYSFLRDKSPVRGHGMRTIVMRDESIEDASRHIKNFIRNMGPGKISKEKVIKKVLKSKNKDVKQLVEMMKVLEPMSANWRIELKDAVTEIMFDMVSQDKKLKYKVDKQGRLSFYK